MKFEEFMLTFQNPHPILFLSSSHKEDFILRRKINSQSPYLLMSSICFI